MRGKQDYSKKELLLFKIYLAKPDLLSDIQKLREKEGIAIKIDSKIIEIPISNGLMPGETLEEYLRETEKNYKPRSKKEIDEAVRSADIVRELIARHNMPDYFLDPLRAFIKTGDIHLVHFTTEDRSSVYVFPFTRSDGKKCVAIEIGPETTIKEIQKRWRDIEESRIKYLGFNPQKQANRKNIDRDLRVTQFLSAGYDPKTIVQKINAEFTTKKISLVQVYKIINSIKNRLDLNKKPLFPS